MGLKRKYYEYEQMSDLICDNHSMLLVMSRFGLSLGFGEKTIAQVCTEGGVHTATFLAVVNLFADGPDNVDISNISADTLMTYLHNAHAFFLDSRFQSIRRKLIEAMDHGEGDIAIAIIRFYDEYVSEVRKHMEYEESTVFPYVKRLMEGQKDADYRIDIFHRQHDSIDEKLDDLKNILIKYYSSKSNEMNGVLFDIFESAEDLAYHTAVENYIFVPLIESMERNISVEPEPADTGVPAVRELSTREKEIVVCVVKGMTNKEIASALNISTHTVMTHRKNIALKLKIHSPAGLTIYALVNKLVDIDQVNPQN